MFPSSVGVFVSYSNKEADILADVLKAFIRASLFILETHKVLIELI